MSTAPKIDACHERSPHRWIAVEDDTSSRMLLGPEPAEPFASVARHDRVNTIDADIGARPAATAPVGFPDLYRGQYAPMVRLVRVVAGPHVAAEDIVQEAFADLYRAFARVESPAAYLRRAVISRSVSALRRRRVELRYLAQHRPIEVAAPLSPDGAAVRVAMSRLRPRQRAALFLRYYLDLPEVEIAAALGCRAGTVKSLLHRSHETLRRYLDA